MNCLDPERFRRFESISWRTSRKAARRSRGWSDEHPDKVGGFDFNRHHYKVLLSIREDFLPELESLRARMPSRALNRLRLRAAWRKFRA